MSNNKIVVPEAKAALEQFKMEAANEEDVPPRIESVSPKTLNNKKTYTYRHTRAFLQRMLSFFDVDVNMAARGEMAKNQ